MASRRRFGVSRSVALSLAALLVLTGAMFMVTTFQQDSEEWVLVEDNYIEFAGFVPAAGHTLECADDVVLDFDEETATYSFSTDGTLAKASSTLHSGYCFSIADGFDYSKNYKIVATSNLALHSFRYFDGTSDRSVFNLRSVEVDDEGVYTADVVLLDQLVTDLSYQTYFSFFVLGPASSGYYDANDFAFQIYELETDNTGSIAAGVTGLVLIVMGVFAMPMHNILRRR